MHTRVIPVLLLSQRGLYKTRRFKQPVYLGDPVNTFRIFNEKCCDEIVLLDIMATVEGRGPTYDLISEIANECFMPLCYGGGVSTLRHYEKLFTLGVEKVAVNSAAISNPDLLSQAAREFGSQSIVAVIDYRRNLWGAEKACVRRGTSLTALAPGDLAKHFQDQGVGEVIVQSIARDGCMSGYDLPLVKSIASTLSIPVIACGGAGGVGDIASVIVDCGAAGAAAGSMFVFQGARRGVLISYPDRNALEHVIHQRRAGVSIPDAKPQ